jgi:hypothetical protein
MLAFLRRERHDAQRVRVAPSVSCPPTHDGRHVCSSVHERSDVAPINYCHVQ